MTTTQRTTLAALAALLVVVTITTTLVVRQNGNAAARCMAIPKSQERILCLKPVILDIARRESPKKALEVAYGYQTQGIVAECHLLAHYVGEDLYARQAPDVATAFSSCSADCVEGCHHGVMAALLQHQADKSNLPQIIRNLCVPVRDDARNYKQCLHGIGHGLLTHDYLSQHDAIATCRTMGTDYESDACLDGVFMENMFPSLALSEADVKARLPQSCGELIQGGDPYLISKCVFETADVLMLYTQYDLPKALDLCTGMQESYVKACQDAVRTWQELQTVQAEKSSDEAKAP